MKIIKILLAFFGGVLSGMRGGQKNKSVRRFGLPGIAFLASIGWDGFQLTDLAMLAFIPVLCLGYGVESWLMGILGFEWLTRLVYAFLLSLPFIVYGFWRWVVSASILIIAFQIHAGSLGHIDWFGDILIEDIARYSALMGLIIFNIVVRRKSYDRGAL